MQLQEQMQEDDDDVNGWVANIQYTNLQIQEPIQENDNDVNI